MRKFIIALILLASVIFLITRLSEVEAIIATLQRGDWRFITLAILLVVYWLINVGASYQAIFRALGMEEKISVLTPLAASMVFLGVVTPSVGVSSIAYMVAQARRRDLSPARAAVASALFNEFDYFGVLSIVALGLTVLFRRNHITMVEITAAVLLFLAFVILGTLVFLGMRSAQELGRALVWLVRLVNKILRPFIRRAYLSEDYALHFAHDAAEGLHDLSANPRTLVTPTLLAIFNKLLLLMILTSIFLAFKVPISIGTLVAGLSLSQLFTIISPTPAGLGVVEGTMTLILSGMYISLEDAVVITMAYRGVTFWLPLLYGLVAFQISSRQRKKEIETESLDKPGEI